MLLYIRWEYCSRAIRFASNLYELGGLKMFLSPMAKTGSLDGIGKYNEGIRLSVSQRCLIASVYESQTKRLCKAAEFQLSHVHRHRNPCISESFAPDRNKRVPVGFRVERTRLISMGSRGKHWDGMGMQEHCCTHGSLSIVPGSC